jgi:hypothetical protein
MFGNLFRFNLGGDPGWAAGRGNPILKIAKNIF